MDTPMRKNHKPEDRVPKWVVAQAYAPELKVTSALKRLDRWMHSCTPLMKALKRTGYTRRAKKISSRQIMLIYNHLGEPYSAPISRK